MRLGEAILRTFSIVPGTADYNSDLDQEGTGKELALLRREFPSLSTLVHKKRVVDFGCGAGNQAVALAREEDCHVCGIDTNARTLSKANELASEIKGDGGSVIFVDRPTSEMQGAFDVVISQNAIEHFPDPRTVIHEMKSLIHRGGKILLTFGPPWLAPYGSHMHFFCKMPWLNILFSERTVMRVRARYRNDGATRYEDVESGLNKMTLRKFEKILVESGLAIQYKKYSCIKSQDWLSKLPIVREFFVNHVSCILTLRDLPST